jgi:hypothetical protein
MPEECYSLADPFRDTIQSIEVDSKSSCTFFMFVIVPVYEGFVILNSDYSLDGCIGPSLFLLGKNATLPSPYPNNTLSYSCLDLSN